MSPGDPFALSGNPNVHTFQLAAVTTANAIGDATLVAAVPGHRIKVYAIVVSATVASSLTWKSGTTALSGAHALAANSTIALAVPPPTFLLATNAGDALMLGVGALSVVSGWIAYWADDTV